jgi:SHS2 domain-containing protein
MDVSINGSDLPDLMVKWLSELLYLFEGERLVINEIGINSMSSRNICADLKTVKFDLKCHEVLREIKAVTYHQIEVGEEKGIWRARVIFDL